MADDPRLLALRVTSGGAEFPIRPATSDRAWMRDTGNGFARRCLPLLMADQTGWEVLNPAGFEVRWDGGPQPESLTVTGDVGATVSSHFGHGVLTWTLPYLFRTSPGYDLLVRGPANLPKDGVSPLEGLVETDWSPATFTVNWMVTRTGTTLTFARDEPIALLVPQRRHELESFRPAVVDRSEVSAEDAAVTTEYDAWRAGRESFLADLPQREPVNDKDAWQGDYFRGSLGAPPAGSGRHRTRRHLRAFEHIDKDVL
jgi:hypothetical protein